MSPPRSRLWNIDPHTKAKHEILRRYLQAWFPILAKDGQPVRYIDGFCGPGRYAGGEEGSPLVAVKAAMEAGLTGTVEFWFIDADEDRIDHLTGELASLGAPKNFHLNAIAGSFVEQYSAILDATANDDIPTFAFIDPFGYKEIPFDVVTRLLKQKRTEILVNVMAEFMNRFLEADNSQVRQHIVNAFGTDQCLSIADMQGGDRMTLLRELYETQLRTAARFVRSFEMSDQSQKTKYYLFFGGNHPLGHYKMKDAMWKVDPGGEFHFTDGSNRQLVMLGDKVHNISNLIDQLHNKFDGQGSVDATVVKAFVRDHTVFLETHFTEALGRCEKDGSMEVDEVNADGSKRQKGSFGKARIKFLPQQGQIRIPL